MEAVQVLQNPGMLVSGKVVPSTAGQMGDATSLPIFEQMFARASAVAGTTGQSVADPVLPQSVTPLVSVSDAAALPSTGQIPVLLTKDESADGENAGGGVVESSEAASSTASGKSLEAAPLLMRILEKAGKTFVQRDVSPEKKLEKKGEAQFLPSEVEKQVVTAEPSALKKQGNQVASVDEDGVSEGAKSEIEEKSEGSSEESGKAFIPGMTLVGISPPVTTAASRTSDSGESFRIPSRSAFEAGVMDRGNGGEGVSPVSGEGRVGSGPSATAVAEPMKSDDAAFPKTAALHSAPGIAAPVEGAGSTDTAVPEVLSARDLDDTKTVGKLGRQETGNPDMTHSSKMETVLRTVPGGVTVANPARTVLMGNSDASAGMAKAIRSVGESESQPARRVEEDVQVVSEASISEAGQPDAVKHAPVSSGGGSQQHNAGEGKTHPDVSVTVVSSGSFERALQGGTETQPTAERSALHDSILSQVEEKLASPEAGTGTNRITLKLNPRELGDMQIQIRMEDAKVSVEITAQNPVVREALVQNLDQLKETLSRRDIAMERFDVMTGNGQTSNQSFREGRQAAQPRFDDMPYPDGGYYREESVKSAISYGEARENSLVDMRF